MEVDEGEPEVQKDLEEMETTPTATSTPFVPSLNSSSVQIRKDYDPKGIVIIIDQGSAQEYLEVVKMGSDKHTYNIFQSNNNI